MNWIVSFSYSPTSTKRSMSNATDCSRPGSGNTQAIPGAFYLWTVEHLFHNNELVAGTLRVGNETVDLGRITCPIYLLAGAKDDITPPPQVFALAQYVGTERDQIVQRQTTGGHLGLFIGHEALRNHWAPLLNIATR